MTLRRRLDRLEARRPLPPDPVEVVFHIVAPSPAGPWLCAVLRRSDGLKLDRHPGEAEAAFRARAEAALEGQPG